MLDRTFFALSDPTRRAIVARLAHGSGLSVNTLARPFPISLPAVIKHLDVLSDAGLLTRTRTGRTVSCRLVGDPMADAVAWIERHLHFWESRLDALVAVAQAPVTDQQGSIMTIKNVLAGVAVANLDKAIGWYTRLIGRAPDDRPMPEVAEYRFGGGGWLQIFADADRAGQSSVTLTVDDLDARLGELKAAGIEAGSPTRSDYVDTAIVADPDGNQIVFAEAKSASNKAAA